MEIGSMLITFAVLAVPIFIAMWSVVSMKKYHLRDKTNPEECKKLKIQLIISTTLSVIMLLAIAGFIIFIFFALQAMT